MEKKIKKNKNGNKEIEAKNRVKLRIFSEGRRQDFFVKKKGEVPKKSFLNLAENCEASSLWVDPHRYTRILCVSKPLWANNAHKVEPNTRPIKNLSKSLLILKSPKTNLKLPFLIAQSSPIFSILQYCRAIGGCYWTYIAKK